MINLEYFQSFLKINQNVRNSVSFSFSVADQPLFDDVT